MFSNYLLISLLSLSLSLSSSFLLNNCDHYEIFKDIFFHIPGDAEQIADEDEDNYENGENRIQVREHDPQTLAVLKVVFPTWYYSTHGLSRPSSPEPENKER